MGALRGSHAAQRMFTSAQRSRNDSQGERRKAHGEVGGVSAMAASESELAAMATQRHEPCWAREGRLILA